MLSCENVSEKKKHSFLVLTFHVAIFELKLMLFWTCIKRVFKDVLNCLDDWPFVAETLYMQCALYTVTLSRSQLCHCHVIYSYIVKSQSLKVISVGMRKLIPTGCWRCRCSERQTCHLIKSLFHRRHA